MKLNSFASVITCLLVLTGCPTTAVTLADSDAGAEDDPVQAGAFDAGFPASEGSGNANCGASTDAGSEATGPVGQPVMGTSPGSVGDPVIGTSPDGGDESGSDGQPVLDAGVAADTGSGSAGEPTLDAGVQADASTP